MSGWGDLSTALQEEIIGRTKIDNIELNDDAAARKSHKTLATIVDADGAEHDILRDNMPFGRAGHGEFGTYFIGYSRRLWVIEKMLQRMFVGEPAGACDRLLDFSTPQTGVTFFAPSRAALQGLAQGQLKGPLVGLDTTASGRRRCELLRARVQGAGDEGRAGRVDIQRPDLASSLSEVRFGSPISHHLCADG